MSTPTYFETPDAFRAWLAAHADREAELLVGFRKVGSGRPSMTWPESVDEALCVGWIDGVRRRIDDEAYSIRFTPRRPGSIWSAVNLAKVERLRAQGRMTPAGEAAWARRTEAKTAVYAYEQAQPAALTAAEQQAFQGHAQAWAYFETCPPGYRQVVLHWVGTAQRPATRAARLTRLIAACQAGRRLR